jgi:hypothetical protein
MVAYRPAGSLGEPAARAVEDNLKSRSRYPGHGLLGINEGGQPIFGHRKLEISW